RNSPTILLSCASGSTCASECNQCNRCSSVVTRFATSAAPQRADVDLPWPAMSDLYDVRVAARPDAHTVELDIKVVHPDAMHIPESPGFALMLLHDRASGDAPLARELDLDTIMNGEWASANACAFIESVELISSKNQPPPEALDDYEHRY